MTDVISNEEWTRWGGREDRFSGALGGHWYRVVDGAIQTRAEPEERHLNNGGFLHGGYLMGIADQSLFAVARPYLSAKVHAVTITFNCEFLGGGVPGESIIATGEVLRETGKMLFIRGMLSQLGVPIVAFSGTLRKVPRRT